MKETRLQTVLLVVVLVLVTVALVKPATSRRFIPRGDDQYLALDTVTGMTCWSVPPGKDHDPNGMPLCKDIR